MVERNTIGQFVRGHQIAKGRPQGAKNRVSADLFDTIIRIEQENKTSLYEHFVRRAYEDDRVLIALMKKIVPDQKAGEISINTYDAFLVKIIQKAMEI